MVRYVNTGFVTIVPEVNAPEDNSASGPEP
jgi:hypothetical protein